MTEIEINRTNHLIDPGLHIWGWEIPLYLFLGGMTAGMMILSFLLSRRQTPGEPSRWVRWLPLRAPVILSLGMLALLFDLELKLHVYRFYTAFEVTSPMSWGSWILLLIYPAALLLGLASLTERELSTLSRWGGPLIVLRWAHRVGQRHLAALRWSNLVLGIGLGGYTGILLGTLGARPAWNSAVLGPLFLVSGFSTGAALLMLLPISDQERAVARRWDMAAVIVELLLLGVFLMGLATGGEAARQAAQLFLGGRYTALFWSLVVIAGLLVPLLVEMLESRRGFSHAYVAPLLLLVGGLSLRWILVAAGQG